eukprot:TRINITY_DN15476_c0_g1_i3.p1 TRINITY_DN15476_c0_g1~~TRINITY_DN15476_c0_g1_i3.p1  ORF type:complete len:168 (+),score=40.85 TRINITY_DN15476_c0_g1_i3:253-756(+)
MTLASAESKVIKKIEVGDNHCAQLVVDMGKNSSLCQVDDWWLNNAWHYTAWTNGDCPKPYTHLDRIEHPIGVSCVDLNTYGSPAVAPLVDDVAEEKTIHNISPGGAHCTEIYINDPATNAYWKAHGYQYPTVLWPVGECDRKIYNWFNRNGTIAEGVTSKTWGIHQN